MEQYNYPPQVSVIPDAEERKQIRRRYNLIALVILVNIFIFNAGGRLIKFLITVSCGNEIWKNELFRTVYSCGIPCISEITSIIAGIILLKTNFPPLAKRDGYGAGTVAKLMVLSLGLQGAASFMVTLISMLLKGFGLEGGTPDFTVTGSAAANIVLCSYVCLVAPVLEEMFYRGVLLQSLRRYNERFAIFLSAMIFGLMHQNYQQALAGFALGIPLAVITVKYGSIIPSILAHMMINTSGTLTEYLVKYTCPELYRSVFSGDLKIVSSFAGISPAGMTVIMLNAVFRYGTMLAALIIGISAIAKGGNMSRPTPAGKARTMPVFRTAALWWIVFALYLFLTFIYPFIRK